MSREKNPTGTTACPGSGASIRSEVGLDAASRAPYPQGVIKTLARDAGYLAALGFDFAIVPAWLGAERAREIGRELLEALLERLTHLQGEALPVRVGIVDGPGSEEWTVVLDGEADDVDAVWREILRVIGLRESS